MKYPSRKKDGRERGWELSSKHRHRPRPGPDKTSVLRVQVHYPSLSHRSADTARARVPIRCLYFEYKVATPTPAPPDPHRRGAAQSPTAMSASHKKLDAKPTALRPYFNWKYGNILLHTAYCNCFEPSPNPMMQETLRRLVP